MKQIFQRTLFLILITQASAYEEKKKKKNEEEKKPISGHVFGWPFLKSEKMQPRGGTTKGGDVTLFEGAKESWKNLQEEGLSTKERDRRAILAMQGSYRVSFDFMETVGFTENFKPAKPYFSWGSERVILLEDSPDFISLQHVMVMYFKDKEGKETGPHVMKHWRQDWTFEDNSTHSYIGDQTWQKHDLKNNKGTWTQAVYQVDDSPRYEVAGTWEHLDNKSTWRSEDCWRPLPRRERSVRKDYNVMGGRHEITIAPNGWVHLQNNKKLNVEGENISVLAHELGINRYEEITSPDLKAGDEQFKATEPYWAEVRKKWNDIYANSNKFSLTKEIDGKKLWMHHFKYAGEVAKDGWKPEEGKTHATETIEKYLQ